MRSLRLLPLIALALVGSLGAAEALPKADFVPAFNGKDLTGWKTASTEAFWTVADGVLAGENKDSFKDYKKGSMLYTEKSYQDVVIECECRFNGEIDSGIMVRRDEAGKKDIQMQIGVSRSLKKDMTGAFYTGKYPEVWINGEQVANYVDAGYPKAAPVGLQVHGGVKMKVEYRNIQVAELK